MQKLVAEIDGADKEGQLSEFVTWQESNKLPYLQACIKEALRKYPSVLLSFDPLNARTGMHPPVGLLIERHVPKGGIFLGGNYFPEGTIVGINPWVTA